MSTDFLNLDVKKCELVDKINDEKGPRFDAILKKHKLSDDEYDVLKNILGRTPTFSELGVASAMWSEHCSYKSSRVHLGRFPTEGEQVVVGPGENAGIIKISDKLCAAFKMESHNHPSYIEPYNGAATGVGGILRDVFCMGSRPIANLNCLRFGRRDHEKTPWLFANVVRGIGDYGNCIGIPTVGGNISFDPSYDGNCLVNAMTVGLIHEDRIFKGYASGLDNLVVYVGSDTGRDGIHGATMASDSFETSEASERGAIQVGDPFMEKLLLEATLEVLDKDLVVGIQDMGAAGLTSSSFEMADRAKSGLLLDLTKVPVRTSKMTAYELLLSESQERMLMVIKPEKWEELAASLEKWNLHYAVIGKVTDTGRMQAIFDGKLELDVPVEPMVEAAPKYERPMKPRAVGQKDEKYDQEVVEEIKSIGEEAFLSQILAGTGNKAEIFHQYDHHIGTKTVLGSEQGGAAVMWLKSDIQEKDKPYLGMLISTACNERYCKNNPKVGGTYSVVRSARMIAAAGGTPLAITDCLNFGNPEVPEVMWEFSEAVDGISQACIELNTPVVSGNVSLYNETDGESIAPTPMIGMVGKMDDVRKAVAATTKENSELYLLKSKNSQGTFGASYCSSLLKKPHLKGDIPALNFAAEKQAISVMQEISANELVNAARDVGDGGVLSTMAKMALNSEKCLEVDSCLNSHHLAFGEHAGAYVIAVKSGKDSELEALVAKHKEIELVKVGKIADQSNGFEVFGKKSDWNKLAQSYFGSLEF